MCGTTFSEGTIICKEDYDGHDDDSSLVSSPLDDGVDQTTHEETDCSTKLKRAPRSGSEETGGGAGRYPRLPHCCCFQGRITRAGCVGKYLLREENYTKFYIEKISRRGGFSGA